MGRRLKLIREPAIAAVHVVEALINVPVLSRMQPSVDTQTETTMRLILPILLIPMVLAGQSLCAVHSHIGMHSRELGGHGCFPHFHADAGHDHSHSHLGLHSNGGGTDDEPSERSRSGIDGIPEQNDGAYYVQDSVSRGDKRLIFDQLSGLLGKLVGYTLPTLLIGTFAIPKADRPRGDRLSDNARVPLFLRDASIRC